MAIWSEYMREWQRLINAGCEVCQGLGQNVITQGETAEVVGAEACEACKGTGYATPRMNVMTLDQLEAQMRAVARGEMPAPVEAGVASREPYPVGVDATEERRQWHEENK